MGLGPRCVPDGRFLDGGSYDVVVAGSGVAGLTSSIFCARYGWDTTLLAPEGPGGALLNVSRIEDFPGFPSAIAGFDLGPTIQEQALDAGVVIRPTSFEAIASSERGWIVNSGRPDELHARAIIMATGTRPRELGVPGEKEWAGRGVSTCASCDGPLFKNKRAVIVGAGDTGMSEALELREHGVSVTVVERRPDTAPQASYRRRVQADDDINVLFETEVVEVIGEEAVTAVRVRDQRSGNVEAFGCDAVFICAGRVPNTTMLDGLLALDDAGRIITTPQLETEIEGIFAAGDVRSGSSGQAVGAAGDGAAAAAAVHRFLCDEAR